MEVDEFSYPRGDVAVALPTYQQVVGDVRRIQAGKSENISGVIVTRNAYAQMAGWREWHIATPVGKAVETATDVAAEILNYLLESRDKS